ncbi:putative ABC transporter ATP-binding protein YbhF [Legionella massiliensis]|uniref:Putative ABC transporter ATP-binding protein YbhF n=1 Tax=Legionella massiliensis TaxID=1034943 RepID=A0A078KU14_9GAMM|nr:ABC transporter ATP-binding protein [Legionella massiliensis]CDZ76536.1 putative ABC transporter ATP-binding protein YbhF [Legionella massiliensis]CEE12274.1 putative ABC transporter ATP-binding protein YbhF [Legionella massiliensis]
MNEELIIDVKELCKIFDDKPVVKSVNLQVKKGEIFGFLGPNGSGKTTTIRMLCGLLTPDSGQGTCLGYDIIEESKKIKQHVGYMTQKFSFYNELSIQENLMLMARIYCLDRRKERVEKALEDLGLQNRRRQLTKELSGGWKQRLALAACLLHQPNLLLLDEPTAGVDPLARREFWDKIHLLSEQGVTTLVSTHYMDEAERCTRLAYLAYGHLLITGTIKEVIAATKLHTWMISGEAITKLLQESKQLDGVTQVALFGNQLHVCGYEIARVEKGLNELAKKYIIHWQLIATTLEDAFIALVNQSQGEPH